MNSSSPSTHRLGDILLKYELITPEQLEASLQEQQVQKKRLGSLLIQKGLLTEEDMNFVLSQQLDVPYVHLTQDMIDPDLVKIIPREIMERYELLPLIAINDSLSLAMSDPTDHEAICEVKKYVKHEIKPALVKSSSIRHILEILFNEKSVLSASDFPETRIESLKDLIRSALKENANEIHMESSPRHIQVRFRIKGELVRRNVMDISSYQTMLNNFKSQVMIEAGSVYLPYSKAYAWEIDGLLYYLEAHTLQTIYGESLTLRIHSGGKMMDEENEFPELSVAFQNMIDSWMNKKTGEILLITNSPSSQNNRLAYGILNQCKTPTQKICTLEQYPSYINNQYTQAYMDFRPGFSEELLISQLDRMGADIIYVDMSHQYPKWESILNAAIQKKKVLIQTGYKDILEFLNMLKESPQLMISMSNHLHSIIGSVILHTLCSDCRVAAKLEGTYIPGTAKKRYIKGKGCKNCHQTGYTGESVYYELFSNHLFPSNWWKQKSAEKIFEEVCDILKQPSIRKQIESPLTEGLLSIEETNSLLSEY